MTDTRCDHREGDFEHAFPVRVYYEDTDAGGIVYHASHVRFFERGRTEFLRALGLDQFQLANDGPGLLFAVRRMEIDYLRAARLDELLTVRTGICGMGGARVTMKQSLVRGEDIIATAIVTVVGITRDGHARRIPDPVRALLGRPETP